MDGSYHDSFIMKNCCLFQKFENRGYQPFLHAVMLGDEGVPTYLSWLVTPFLRGIQNPCEQYFNQRHSAAQMLLEILFGHWKNKFRILLNSGIRFSKWGNLAQAVKLVQVLAEIWNFILAQNNSDDNDNNINECPRVSVKELNDFGVIADLFRQIGGHSSRFVLFCSF